MKDLKKQYIFLSEGNEGKYASYQTMIKTYCDNNLILCNDIISITQCDGHEWELYNGSDYIEEDDYYIDIYQYYIIDSWSAELLAENTNEII